MPKLDFEEFRKDYRRKYPKFKNVEDGAVILAAIQHDMFQDPESGLPLWAMDMRALGITAQDSNQKIIERLR